MKNFYQAFGVALFTLSFLLFQVDLIGQTSRYVAPIGADSGDCTDSGSPCLTIQYAIDQAVSGDVISVLPGTYEENVNINKPLTLTGSNAGNDCSSRADESTISPSSGAPIVISSDNVTVNGFEINAPNHGFAIELSNTSDVSVLYNNINDIGTDPGFTGGVNSNTVHSIRYQLDGGTYSNIDISNNCISNISHIGNTFNSASGIGILQSTSQGTLSNLNIENNTIEEVISNTGDWGDGGRIAYSFL